VFYVRDPVKFPDYIRTQKRLPDSNKRSATAMWDFWSRNPESLHQVTILMSDRGLPASPRFMDGFGSHTYSFYNEAGARFWVKIHFKSLPRRRGGGVPARSVRRDCVRGVSAMAPVRADHARSRGRGSALRSIRRHQGLAARGLPVA
jgi:hypothetical protein